MIDVLFGQSYYLRFDPKLWAAMQPYPPLATLYAAAYVRSSDYSVAFFDAMLAVSEVEWETALDRHRPRFAVLYEDNFNYLSKMCLLRMREAALTMIAAARARGCVVIVSGSDATDHPDIYLSGGAHFILIGEGEHTLVELLDCLTERDSRPPSMVSGVAYLDSDTGQVMRTPRRPDIRDLDSLPFPAWDLVDVPRYQSLWYRHHGRFSMNVVTTRGCPFHCNWCAKPIWGQRYNTRSPENVLAELRWLEERYHPDHIWFADDIMGLKPRWIHRFADLVEESGLSIPFKSLHRADLLLRHGTIDALRRARAETVWMGAESGSQNILDAMDKGTRTDQILEATREMKRAGIRVGWFLQFGYLGEGREDIEKTLQMVRDGKPDDIGISVSYPLPGTPFFQTVQQQLGVQQNWIDSSDMAMLYKGPFSTAFYRKLHTVVHKGFRGRKAADDIRSVLRRPATVRRHHARAVARLLYYRGTLPIARWQMNRLAVPSEHPPVSSADIIKLTAQPD